ncbi:MAG TPA: DUF2336 domain-containing protein [Geminicoccaceae bacterium]|nr:DUF2336 domain-containing protein [Geminicoccaceae bacterium]
MSAQASQHLSGAQPGPVAGRRRAQLVANGAKAEQRLSRTDVQALQVDPSPASRGALATKFGRQYDQLIEGRTRALADAVLELLVRDAAPQVRQALAQAVAASPGLPQAVAGRLARDELSVARPILELSPVLSDHDLGQIVRAHAVTHALAVAGRGRLSEALCGLLVDTKKPEVVAALLGNGGAELTAATCRRIRKDYGDDPAIQDRLIRRPNLPYELVDDLLTAIGARLEWQVLCERRMSKAEARQLMAAVRDRATAAIDPREVAEASVERQLRHRFTSGELGPEDVLRMLRDGAIVEVEASLALLADVGPARAHQLLHATDQRALAALCARAKFGAPHYIAMRMVLDLAEQGFEGSDPEATYSPETITAVQRQYDLARADRSQVAFWFTT